MDAERITAHWKRLPHPIRWVAAASVGATLVVVGLIFMVLPGPGIPLVILGLIVLATEFAWAEAVLHRVRTHGARVAGAVRRRTRGRSSGERAPSGHS